MMISMPDGAQDIYRPLSARLVDIQPMTDAEKYFKFEMEEALPAPCLPGQFMEVSVPGIGEAPISISSSPTRVADGEFEMVIREVGNVTRALHGLEPGARVGMRGPFGTTFPVQDTFRGRDLVFVCGGIGLVPVRSAINYVLDNRDDYGNVTILFGTRRPQDRLFVDELYEWKTREDLHFLETVDIADRTWGGNVGVITTLFNHLTVDAAQTTAVICGPPIMYKFVLLELRKLGLDPADIFVSVERHMKCGVGKCGHCQINGLYACQEGPVMNYAAIRDVKEAI